ncbi:hypothetical protein SeMB42_g00210 [Synchytrium endobioticum]|uniref:Uncharacterized protein n=1 Tax=Synchytrium endobioticum TaxID=286115 RepID=A0A507DS14_9FUNG|nr:hypothetical protein SeMB42_g00210 [Synchytrium endobioticum]
MIIDDIWRSNRDIHLLQQLTHGGKGGANYWTNLLRMIIDGQICGTGPVYRPILEKVSTGAMNYQDPRAFADRPPAQLPPNSSS